MSVAPDASLRRQSGRRDESPVSDFIGYQLRRAHTLFALHWQANARLEGLSVTPVQGGMLVEIASSPGISQIGLARRMNVEGPTLIRMVDRLELCQLIRRERHATDRRRYALYLTDAGEEAVAGVRRFVAKRDAELLGGLAKSEQALLLSLLQRVVGRGQIVLDDTFGRELREVT